MCVCVCVCVYVCACVCVFSCGYFVCVFLGCSFGKCKGNCGGPGQIINRKTFNHVVAHYGIHVDPNIRIFSISWNAILCKKNTLGR
jgi:hypothetical protein